MGPLPLKIWFACKECRQGFQEVTDFLEHKKETHFNQFQRTKCIIFEERSFRRQFVPVPVPVEIKAEDESQLNIQEVTDCDPPFNTKDDESQPQEQESCWNSGNPFNVEGLTARRIDSDNESNDGASSVFSSFYSGIDSDVVDHFDDAEGATENPELLEQNNESGIRIERVYSTRNIFESSANNNTTDVVSGNLNSSPIDTNLRVTDDDESVIFKKKRKTISSNVKSTVITRSSTKLRTSNEVQNSNSVRCRRESKTQKRSKQHNISKSLKLTDSSPTDEELEIIKLKNDANSNIVPINNAQNNNNGKIATITNSFNQNCESPLFECNLCSQQSKTQSDLQIHLEFCSFYNKKRKRFCLPCNKLLSSTQALESHICRFHETEKKDAKLKLFKCPVCNSWFCKKTYLNAHLRKHGKVRPFKCDRSNCDKAFKFKQNLTQHLKSHSTSPERFKCLHQGCEKTFNLKLTFNRHMRTHSMETERPHRLLTTICNSIKKTGAGIDPLIPKSNCKHGEIGKKLESSYNGLPNPYVVMEKLRILEI